MARKQKGKDKKKWIAANDPIFTGDAWDLARTFLDGYVSESTFVDDIPNPKFKFLRPGSPEEARAREALVQVLRSTVVEAMRDKLNPPSDGLFLILLRLADLFDEQERPYRLPQRKLTFKARSGRRQSHTDRDLQAVWFIYAELAKDRDMESTVAAAVERFGGSRATINRAWKKYGKVVAARAAAEILEQLDDRAGYD